MLVPRSLSQVLPFAASSSWQLLPCFHQFPSASCGSAGFSLAAARVLRACGSLRATGALVNLPPLRSGIFQRYPCVSFTSLRGIGFGKSYQCPSLRSTHSQPPCSFLTLTDCHPCSTRRRHAILVCRAAYRSSCYRIPLSTHPPASRLAAGAFTCPFPHHYPITGKHVVSKPMLNERQVLFHPRLDLTYFANDYKKYLYGVNQTLTTIHSS